MPTRLYLDTARLGLMSPTAQRIQIDFAKLASEEAGTLYFEQLLQDGFDAWPDALQRRFSALRCWHGVSHLKRNLKRLVGASSQSHVIVANRSAELMRMAARLLFDRCHHVLTTDLSWPRYQHILKVQARRSGRRITRIRLRRRLLRQKADVMTIVKEIARRFVRNQCDSLFLPAVDNLGIRIPIREIVETVRCVSDLRFVVVDGAQAVNHIPISLAQNDCDLFLTGCHKWLGAYNPMGVMYYGNPRSSGDIERMVRASLRNGRADDPLLRFTEEIMQRRNSRYGETAALLPLFTCQGALDDAMGSRLHQHKALMLRTMNADRLQGYLGNVGWSAVTPARAMRTGICLLQADNSGIATLAPSLLRQLFHEFGLAVTAYQNGLVRLSIPPTILSTDDVDHIRRALAFVADASACRGAATPFIEARCALRS